MTPFNYATFPVLVVDDEPHILKSFSIMLKSSGLRNVLTESDPSRVMDILAENDVSTVVLDLSMPGVSGLDLLGGITASFPEVPVIIVTARNELDTAVECMRAGAFDYLVKPVEKSRFESTVRRALELNTLRSEINQLKEHLLKGEVKHESVFSPIITADRKMHAVFQYIEVIGPSGQPVLVTGETGVGKELVARAVHEVSGREGPFVEVNVAGLDDTMFSDTLFGHRRGAYTGADDNREGLVARAAGGTLFLDEIGDTSEASQVKLLRLLQEQKYYPLGSDVSKQSDARVVVATNKDLYRLVEEGGFRRDLYYRLFAHHVQIPPLRERKSDIPLLLNHFLEEAASEMGRPRPTPPAELVQLLRTYSFPGNIREFQAIVYDAVARHKSGVLSMESFRKVIGDSRASSRGHPAEPASGPRGGDFSDNGSFSGLTVENFPTMKEAEERLIDRALDLSGGNQGIAAGMLGMTRQALNKRLKRRKD